MVNSLIVHLRSKRLPSKVSLVEYHMYRGLFNEEKSLQNIVYLESCTLGAYLSPFGLYVCLLPFICYILFLLLLCLLVFPFCDDVKLLTNIGTESCGCFQTWNKNSICRLAIVNWPTFTARS
jgi:hypothetical protein